MIISPFILGTGASKEVINLFSEFGIALLLFLVGLHMNPKVIKEIGSSALLIGVGQILLTFGAGFFVCLKILNFDLITSAYVGIALAFSSTIIIMKLLSDRKQLDSLYGKISVGILIIQDLVAIGVLMFISSISGKNLVKSFAFENLLWGAGLIGALFLIGYLVVPRMTRSLARSPELLFLFSICWCFVIAALFSLLGFSIEIGALIAGIILSISPYSAEISSKVRPLRDFFLIIFFIILGLNVQISSIGSIIVNAIILSLVALILKPFLIIIFMSMLGYTKRNNFLVGITLAQISEFSLIVLSLGVAMNHISPEVLSTLTLTGIITITLSTYMIIYSKEFYRRMPWILSRFERKHLVREKKSEEDYDTILFGYNRMGFSILNTLKRLRKKYLIVDFNPDIIADLHKLKVPSVYGDAYDSEFLEELPLKKIEMAISTIPDFETNLILIEHLKKINSKVLILVRAETIDEAFELYKKGANYVLTPHFLGGQFVAKMIASSKLDKKNYNSEKIKHIKMLEERKKKIQMHLDTEALN